MAFNSISSYFLEQWKNCQDRSPTSYTSRFLSCSAILSISVGTESKKIFGSSFKMPFFNKKQSPQPISFDTVPDGLKMIYKERLLPLEKLYKFHDFHSAPLGEIFLLVTHC